MATNLHATIRSTEMTEIVTLCSSSSHLFLYSGSPPSKTASPTGTSIVTGGIALNSTMGTTSTDGTDAGTKLTLSGTPLTATSAYTGTPGYYRVVIGATDDGAHTAIQGICNVLSAGTGNVTATAGSTTITFASSQSSLAGTYIQVSGDSSNGSYLITNGSGTTWYIGTPYGGTTATTTWTTTPGPAGLNFTSTVASGGTLTISAMTWTEGNV
jgi:hypothetical protein